MKYCDCVCMCLCVCVSAGVVDSPKMKGDGDIRIFVALFPYDPAIMSPNPDAAEEELPFTEGQIIKVCPRSAQNLLEEQQQSKNFFIQNGIHAMVHICFNIYIFTLVSLGLRR